MNDGLRSVTDSAGRGGPHRTGHAARPRHRDMSPAQYVSVSLATCVGLCRFGEAWAALRAENLLTYLLHAARPRRTGRRRSAQASARTEVGRGFLAASK